MRLRHRFFPLMLVASFLAGTSGAQLSGVEILDLNRRETLGDVELNALLQEWDDALDESLFHGGSRMISRVARWLTEAQYKRRVILRYNNPEIVDKVIDLYIAEYQRLIKIMIATHETVDQSNYDGRTRELNDARYRYNTHLLETSLKRDGQKYDGRFLYESDRSLGESEADDLSVLCSVAESTFSPRLYDYVWSMPFKGQWANIYLAAVLPERTLSDLLQATTGEWMGVAGTSSDILRRREDGAGMALQEAFEVLALMGRFSRGTLDEHRVDVISFLKHYARHYLEVRSDERFNDARDVGLRLKAMTILETLAQEDDIDFIGELLQDVPDLPRQKRFPDKPSASEQLRARGESLIKRLQSQ